MNNFALIGTSEKTNTSEKTDRYKPVRKLPTLGVEGSGVNGGSADSGCGGSGGNGGN